MKAYLVKVWLSGRIAAVHRTDVVGHKRNEQHRKFDAIKPSFKAGEQSGDLDQDVRWRSLINT